MQSDSGRVNDLFTASAQNWRPDAAQGEAYMIYAPFFSDAQVTELCEGVLSQTELDRAGRFITNNDAEHFIQRRAFRRYCGSLALGTLRPLSEIAFSETDKGRPYLSESPDLSFSFSSCRIGFLGAWSSTHAIGIDIEDKNTKVEPIELANRFFTRSETKIVEAMHGPERRDAFLQLWCLKEAALKSIGEGLPFGLDACEFELTPHVRIVRAPYGHGGPDVFRAFTRQDSDTCAAFVIRDRA